ncbi:MAG: GNAT family N-acetyltransferase [Cyclobacteriaceae bacterium]
MTYQVKEISGKSALKRFIKFPMELYKGVYGYVPPIMQLEISTFLPHKNPAFDHCEAKFWIVEEGSKIVGRIAAIIHRQEFEEKKLARFGWIDFDDNEEISKLLIETASVWAKSKGASGLHGPLGFSDNDFMGSLISGFDQMATQATIYNFPYYQSHFEALGFTKAVDWVEARGWVPDELPRRLTRSASIVSSRFGLRSKKFKNRKEILPYAEGVFKVLNQAYKGLYGFYELSDRQIKYYVDQYFGFVDKDFLSIIVNKEDEVVGAGISLPSLSKAFKKANGNLFPFGFIHVLMALRSKEHLDMLLIGVDPKYQKMGANVLMFHEVFQAYKSKGVRYVSTGPMLENNQAVLNLWNEFENQRDQVDIRRRCYLKEI